MPIVSKPSHALQCRRLTAALAAVSLCTLISACGNDDNTPDPGAVSSTESPTSNSNGNTAAVLPADPSSALPSAAALTIQSPARPASSADPALSAAASTPLATPVIHTAD